MALITIPSVPANSIEMFLVRRGVALEGLSGAEVFVDPPGTRWGLNFTLKPLSIADAREWQAALIQLAKLNNSFEITPPGWLSGTGYAGANPLVNGASQAGLSLICDGASFSTAISSKGDYISFNNELKMLTAAASTDGAGNVTFPFEPAMRAAPSDGATVNVKTPVLTARLLSPKASWAIKLGDIYGFQVQAVEVYV